MGFADRWLNWAACGVGERRVVADEKDEYGLEILKSRVTLAVEALKLLTLVNGGAAVAVLTYLGHFAKEGWPSSMLAGSQSALLWFSAGLLSALFAFIAAYAAQARLHVEHLYRQQPRPPASRHQWSVWVGLVCAIASAMCFGIGAYVGASALTAPR